MSRTSFAFLAALLAAGTFAVPAFGAVTLTGVVGPGFTITLKKGSAKVTTLKPGKYTIVVHDMSSVHDFHLLGPGLNKKTSVPAKGTSIWKVTLRKGTYRYLCDPHASLMKGSFKVS